MCALGPGAFTEGTSLTEEEAVFFSFKEEGNLRAMGSLGPSTHLERVKISSLLSCSSPSASDTVCLLLKPGLDVVK